MHILFLSHYFPPEVNAPASRTYEHARLWAREPGTRVTVVTNHPHHPYGILYPGYVNRWLSTEEVEGIEVRRVKTYLAPNAGFARRLGSYLFFMAAAVLASLGVRRPDVVVATSPQFFCAVGGYLISRLHRRPFIFELRDIWPESIATVGALRSTRLLRLLERLELFLYRQAALVVAVTDAFKANLVSRGIPADKIAVIKNGVDLAFFTPRPAPPELRRELGLEGKLVASYIGTVGMAHAVEGIVAAAERVRDNPELAFLIVGDGAQKQAVADLVAAKGLKNVIILPGVDKPRVRDFYALSDINLVTLKKAALFCTVIPSKIFEIMGMGRPILTTVNGECRGIISAAGAGLFVEPEEPEQLAAALLRLAHQPDVLEQWGRQGRQYVEQNFSRDVMARRFWNLLRRVGQSPEGP